MRKIIAYIMVILIMAALPVLSASEKESESLVVEDKVIKASDMLAQKACAICDYGNLSACERREVVDGIYEYTYTFSIGGEFDKIGIHRVVKESQPWKPVNTKIGIMMVPGDWTCFRTMYMLSAHPAVLGADVVAPDHSLAIYLAEQNVDVWGIDLRRSFIPPYYPETYTPYCNHSNADNCSFMEDWNMTTQLNDLQFATKFAREMRSHNSQKRDLFMLGASRGGRLTYAYANEETQQPEKEKDLKGIITMDIAYKSDPDAEVFYCEDYYSTCTNISASDAAYEEYQRLESLASNGIYYDGAGMSLKGLAYLATEWPDDDCYVLPGFTNIEVCELAISASYLFMPPPPEITLYHYCEGTFNETGHPTGLVYTNFDYMVLLASNMVSWQSVAYMRDDMAIVCNCSESPYDDHLSEITVPVLYVGGENGFGGYGNYTTTLLGSDDVTIHIVPGHAHVDILYADNAESEVWNPIYEWLVDHQK